MLRPDKYDEAMTLISEIGVKYPHVARKITEHLDEEKLESIFDSYVIDTKTESSRISSRDIFKNNGAATDVYIQI